MALVKCKECGEEVSTKAKSCPKCGAKAPKKTSLFTWLVLLFIIFIVYSASKNPKTVISNTQSNISATPKEIIQKTPPPKPSWSTSTSKDEMTGKFSAYAHSPRALPSKQMSFPYTDVYSYMGVGCDSDSEWVYFGFNTAPNLTKDETKDGYNLIETRLKWDDQVENVSLTQNWGAKFIHFRNYDAAISNISASNSALLELQWHGQQSVYFDFTLNGSSKALSEIRALCSKNK